MLSWVPPQKHSSLDPVGCMEGLTFVAKLVGSEKIDWIPPESIEEIIQNNVFLPKIGNYPMVKVPNNSTATTEQCISMRYLRAYFKKCCKSRET